MMGDDANLLDPISKIHFKVTYKFYAIFLCIVQNQGKVNIKSKCLDDQKKKKKQNSKCFTNWKL